MRKSTCPDAPARQTTVDPEMTRRAPHAAEGDPFAYGSGARGAADPTRSVSRSP
jgi:hypothetical protein